MTFHFYIEAKIKVYYPEPRRTPWPGNWLCVLLLLLFVLEGTMGVLALAGMKMGK